jgi:hypothetical protein
MKKYNERMLSQLFSLICPFEILYTMATGKKNSAFFRINKN